MKAEYTVKEVMDLWNNKYPEQKVCRQTIHNWSHRFGWVKNADRILTRQKMILDGEKVNQFLENPNQFLK